MRRRRDSFLVKTHNKYHRNPNIFTKEMENLIYQKFLEKQEKERMDKLAKLAQHHRENDCKAGYHYIEDDSRECKYCGKRLPLT